MSFGNDFNQPLPSLESLKLEHLSLSVPFYGAAAVSVFGVGRLFGWFTAGGSVGVDLVFVCGVLFCWGVLFLVFYLVFVGWVSF